MYVHALSGVSSYVPFATFLGALAMLLDGTSGMRAIDSESRYALATDIEGTSTRRYPSKIETFAEFLNGRNCRVLSSVIKAMYFQPNFLSCTKVVYKSLKHSGLFQKICTTSRVKRKRCYLDEKQGLCKFLQQEVERGRMDNVTFAMWGASAGLPQKKFTFDEPGEQLKLEKMQVPGWHLRAIARGNYPKEDQEVRNLDNGGLQCTLKRIRNYEVYDDFEGLRNMYANRLVAGSGLQSLLTPTSSTDVHFVYFDRFGMYEPILHFPLPKHDLMTDNGLSTLVFQGVGAHRVMAIGNIETISLNLMGGGVPDSIPTMKVLEGLDGLERLSACFYIKLEEFYDDVPVRKGMQQWGGNAFFDAKFNPIAIQYRGKTFLKSDSKWETMKFVFRSSLVSTITAYDHLTATHMLAASSLAQATVEELPQNHSLRRILTPHTWGSFAINFKGGINLFAKNMLVHRASPFDGEAFEGRGGTDGLLWRKIARLRYLKFRVAYQRYADYRKTNRVIPEIPFFEDGYELYKVLRKYVQGAANIIYSKDPAKCTERLQADIYVNHFVDNFFEQSAGTPDFWPKEFPNAANNCFLFVEFLSELLFLVSGWHRHVGTVADYFRDTSFVATSWKEGETQARPKQSLLMMLLASTTNADYPKLAENLNEIFSSGPGKLFEKLYADLHTGMQKLQTTVEQRNAKRKSQGRLEFHQMEPKYVEWGVEV